MHDSPFFDTLSVLVKAGVIVFLLSAVIGLGISFYHYSQETTQLPAVASIPLVEHQQTPAPAHFPTTPPPLQLVTVQVQEIDPHLCAKEDDAYFAEHGPAVPRPAGSPIFHNPEFLFDVKHTDNTINWANGFRGKVIVCFVVDEKGMPTAISFPQSPGEDLENHIKNDFSGWRFKPGSFNESQVATQMAYQIIFP